MMLLLPIPFCCAPDVYIGKVDWPRTRLVLPSTVHSIIILVIVQRIYIFFLFCGLDGKQHELCRLMCYGRCDVLTCMALADTSNPWHGPEVLYKRVLPYCFTKVVFFCLLNIFLMVLN